MEIVQRINFDRSCLRWVTNGQRSHGSFNIESVLRIVDSETNIESKFALGTAVLAGNVYSDGHLVKKPSYLYQVAASDEEHIIFRTDTQPKNSIWRKITPHDSPSDPIDANDHRFESLDVLLENESADPVETYAEISRQYHRQANFSGILEFPLADERHLEIEFPIKHINLNPDREMFQVETGPILFADPNRLTAASPRGHHGMIPSFVHFNRLDRAEISIDFPYGKRGSARRGDLAIKILDCKIQLMADRRE